MRTTTRDEVTADEVARWRREQLVDAGFPLPLAARLARDARYDLHALVDLAGRGCEPELAVRILAPAGEEAAA